MAVLWLRGISENMKRFFYKLATPIRALGNLISAPVNKVKEFFLEEPEDTPVSDSIQQVFDEPDSFLEHVTALRKHLLRSLGVLLICILVGFVYLQDLLALISRPIGGPEKLTAVDVTEPIGVGMRIVLLAAFAVALPYIIFESFLFVAPALSRRARIVALLAIPLVVVFFFGGMAFAYLLIIPAGLPVLTEFLNLPTQIRPSSYVRFVTGLMFWFGILFEFPLLAYILTVMRVLSAKVLVKNWRIAVVTIAVLAAVITPTIDPINMLLVMIPLVLLYILSIFLSFLAGGGRGDKRED
jgi:sec-independent protein translocase protein TatC